MMSTLEVVRAGAGSGKTTDLCRTVADAVERGLDPARILATTFTKKAAAELKGRIQAALLTQQDGQAEAHQHADRLELAAIGTVHSVAHQLLSRYAIEMGLSPRLEVITEIVAEDALGHLLGAIPLDDWQPFAECAQRLGVDDLQHRVLALLAAKRGNLISDDDFTTQMASSADRVCELLAPDGPASDDASVSQLYELTDRAIDDITALANDKTKTTSDAVQKLRRLRSQRLPLWGSYLEATKINAGRKSGADGLLDALRHHASSVCMNPALHADIREFSSRLAQQTIRLESQYRKYKAERGLVDYTDLETLLLELLRAESLAAQLSEDFDLILVDEFQDTNPLQLAIFESLRQFSTRSRWVGDPKQAIYGFRDTDPELVDDIWRNSKDAVRSDLPNNHRSQRGLVQLVGELFEPIFGADAKQEPQREAMPRGVERWLFQAKNQADDAISLACGIAKLHEEGIRFGDIAVLARTNRQLPQIADAFDTLGVPYLFESCGLLSTREGAIVLAGLRLVADRTDSLAAAMVMHLLSDPDQDTPDWLIERLHTLLEDQDADESDERRLPWQDDSRLARIECINQTILAPTFITQQVIEALDVPALVQKWGDPARRCSNLDSIMQHAREYEEMAFDEGRAATLNGLILYLEGLEHDEADTRYPPQGHDAVTLMTYHAAKGLEWPVVVLSGLHSDRGANMWTPVVSGGGQDDAGPLDGRVLRSWTWPFGKTDGPHAGLRKGSGLDDSALNSPEGQERSVRENAENLRLLYVGCTRAKQKLVFAHRDGNCPWLNRLTNADSLVNPALDEGEHALEGIDTTYVLRHLNADMVDDCRFAAKQQQRWLTLAEATTPSEFIDRFHSPSQSGTTSEEAEFEIEELPGPSHFPTNANEDQYAAIGDAIHSYLAALPSIASLSDSEKQVVAERCLSAFSVSGLLSPGILVSTGERFFQWVEKQYPGAQWHVETAANGPRAAGGHWTGTIDLVLQLQNGGVVVIDHKSAPIRRQYCAAKASHFAGQLDAYSEILAACGETIESTWIHFPLAGVVARYLAAQHD